MLTTLIVTVVEFCCRFAWLVIAGFAALTGASAYYALTHFALMTDSSQLISTRLPWRQRELALDRAFPQRTDLVVVVVDARSPERAEEAAEALAGALAGLPYVQSVRRPDAGPLFQRNALLFLSQEELEERLEELIRAQPFLGTLAADPSLRGLARALAFIPEAVGSGEVALKDFAPQLRSIARAFAELLAGRDPSLSWSSLLTGRQPTVRDLRRFLYVKPALDYAALEPGLQATRAIRAAAAALELDAEHGVSVRLTGPVPMADEEFATIAEGSAWNAGLTVLAVLLLTWLALRSLSIILAVFLTLAAGLATTAAAGLWLVGALNLVSVAFAVLFIGIGIDFAIQFGVRYRAERHLCGDLRTALSSAAREAGVPLALAAAATTAGFFSFLPTEYRGVSELGLIAGTGMMIAFLTSVTLLPALLTILRPPVEIDEVGYRWLIPVDRALAFLRLPILIATALAVLAGLPLLARVSFDFNPINLRSSKVESVATYLDLMRDPAAAGNNIEILAPDAAAAARLAERLRRLPEVADVVGLDSLIPAGQQQKLEAIAAAARLIAPTLSPEPRPAPEDMQTVAALNEVAEAFARTGAGQAEGAEGRGEALFLASLLARLAAASPSQRRFAERALLPGLQRTLDGIRTSLTASRVSVDGLPQEIVRDWLTGDGRARLEVVPRGNVGNNRTLSAFARAVLTVAPEATGSPILIQQSAGTVVLAFAEAGVLALAAIALILVAVLRRASDLLYTLLPLLTAGVVTLELCVLLDLKLNFANIIALPLLLGVGVAFKIYYVLAWRAGETSLLASSLTRAVFFSAMTTATAFGSLWLSSHPGTASMGKLLSLSLVTTLIAAVVFQPILMGPPRNPRRGANAASIDAGLAALESARIISAGAGRRRRAPASEGNR
jgi:hopanoid biosynthesis associated RND transporter like protein HpnN